MYETDFGSGNIYKFAPDGTKTTFQTGLPHARGMTFDLSGNFYVGSGDLGASIFKITPSGVRSTFASGLDTPVALVFDTSGNLFTTEYRHVGGDILEFSPTGVQSTFASGLQGPDGMVLDLNGNLLVGDGLSGNIYSFKPNGARSTFASGLDFPNYLAYYAGQTNTTPEPGSTSLLLAGMLTGIGVFLKRRRR